MPSGPSTCVFVFKVKEEEEEEEEDDDDDDVNAEVEEASSPNSIHAAVPSRETARRNGHLADMVDAGAAAA
jgi:hypothetical protein